MTLNLDYTDDYKYFDLLESVRLEVGKRTDSGAITTSLQDAHFLQRARRQALTDREIVNSGGALSVRDLTWIFSSKETNSYEPKTGDVLVDEESRRWTVLDVRYRQFQKTWRLTCRDLSLIFQLQDRVDVERAEVLRDNSGAAIKRFPPSGGHVLYRQLECRMQPIQSDITEERGLRGFRTTVECLLDREIEVTNEDRVKFQDAYYEIRGYRQSESVGQPPILQLELMP